MEPSGRFGPFARMNQLRDPFVAEISRVHHVSLRAPRRWVCLIEYTLAFSLVLQPASPKYPNYIA